MNEYLKDMKSLINNDTEFGLGTITCPDYTAKIEELATNYDLLYSFPTDLKDELQGVEDDFNTDFTNNALVSLSELNVNEIQLNVSNTSVVVVTNDGMVDGATGEVSYLTRYYGDHEYAFDDIDRLTIADFIGYDGNGGEVYYTRYMPGFTDVLFSPIMEAEGIDDINDFLVYNAADMEQIVHGADFSATKISPFIVNFLAEAVDIASFGVVPIIEGFVGYDFIRGDKLEGYESCMYGIEGAVNIFTLGGGYLAGGKISHIILNELGQEAAGESASYIAKELGASDGVAFAAEMFARIETGKILGNKLYNANEVVFKDELLMENKCSIKDYDFRLKDDISVPKSKIDFSNEGYVTGEDWNKIFAEKYGAENVKWETKPIEGSLNSKYNLFGDKAHEHLTTVEGLNKKKGGIIGGHTQEAFDLFTERPVNILSKEKLGDGIYEYRYQVGALERGQYKTNPDGSFVWLEPRYTKTVINTEELSINSFENMAKNAFANEVIYETESGQLYIKGVLENGVKIEGYIDKATMELKSYYPCKEYSDTIKIKGVFKNE